MPCKMQRRVHTCALILIVLGAALAASASPSITTEDGDVTITGTKDVCLQAGADKSCLSNQLQNMKDMNAAIAKNDKDTAGKISKVEAQQKATAASLEQTDAAAAEAATNASDANQKLAVFVANEFSKTGTATDAALAKTKKELTDMVRGTAVCYAQGLAYDASTGKCDKNECDDGTHKCHKDATCQNLVGKHACKCNHGFTGDGSKCRRVDICGQDTPKGACGGKGQFCDPDPADHTKYECVCTSGYERVVKNIKDLTKVECKASTVKSFQQTIDKSYISQFFYEGSTSAREDKKPGAEEYMTNMFWEDECVKGGKYIKHSIDCGMAAGAGTGRVLSAYCRENSRQDTHSDWNWFEFHTDQYVGVRRWRMRGRAHSAYYMGRVRLMALNEQSGNWVNIGDLNREPGRCTFSPWQNAQTNTYARRGRFRYFRLTLQDARRGAYHSFAKFELEINEEPRQTYRAVSFQDGLKEVTYSPSIMMDKALSGRPLLANGEQVFDDECQKGRIAYHGMNGVWQQGATWLKFEMKVPIVLLGFKIKARNNRWPSYIGKVELLGSRMEDESFYERLTSNPGRKVEPGECHVSAFMPVRSDMQNAYKWFKIEFWDAGATGYLSASQIMMYSRLASYDPVFSARRGLINYWTFEGKDPYKSIAGRKDTAVSLNNCNNIQSAGGGSGAYAYRFTWSNRRGSKQGIACSKGARTGDWMGGWKFPVGGTHTTFTMTFWWKPSYFGCHNTGSDCAQILFPQPKWGNGIGYFYGANLLALGKMVRGQASTAAYYLSKNKWVHLSLVVLGGTGAYLGINGGELHGLQGQAQSGWKLGPHATVANYESIGKGNTNLHYGQGDVDEVAMWDRALTQHELKEVYDTSRNGKHMPL